ncbi:MAG: helix-turn-helix domain-containing protein, partial [Hypericibacter sp.]
MRERKRQERNDTIIDAAMALFQRDGYEQTTMEEIAARADISPPTLYRYFPRKTELLIALFWKERERLAGALEEF